MNTRTQSRDNGAWDGTRGSSVKEFSPGSTERRTALYIDASVHGHKDKNRTSRAGIGCVLRDGTQNPYSPIEEALFQRGTYLGKCGVTSMEAEYLALIEGLRYALQNGVEYISIFTDNKPLSYHVEWQVNNNKKGKIPSKDSLEEFVQTIESLLDRFSFWNIHHIPRAKNQQADEIARAAVDLRSCCR